MRLQAALLCFDCTLQKYGKSWRHWSWLWLHKVLYPTGTAVSLAVVKFILGLTSSSPLAIACCAAGHSLGGAVALLCTLRLLQSLQGDTPSLHCICFGTPAIGNAALAALVAEYGWHNHILNFILPGLESGTLVTHVW